MIASGVCALALRVAIQLSLILQLWLVFSSEPKRRGLLMAMASAVALLAAALYFEVLVEGSESTMEPHIDIYVAGCTYPAAKATLAASISIFGAIFVFKLAHAIRSRKTLGLKNFGLLQIIVGCRTMILPVVSHSGPAPSRLPTVQPFSQSPTPLPSRASLNSPRSWLPSCCHCRACRPPDTDSQSPIHASGIHHRLGGF